MVIVNPTPRFLLLYCKKYRGPLHEEVDPKKHIITKDQVDQWVEMMCGMDKTDVVMARKILAHANCNEYYEDIVWRCITYPIPSRRWVQDYSEDGINRRITRFI